MTTILIPVEGAKLREATEGRRRHLKAIIADHCARSSELYEATGMCLPPGVDEQKELRELETALPTIPKEGVCYIDTATAARLGLASETEG